VKRLFVSTVLISAFVAFVSGARPGLAASAASAVHYYVALGDSLAEGYQPNGDVGHGYADQLYAELEAVDPTLQLENLACGGETTSSMISGVKPWRGLGSRYFCGYRARSAQLAHGSQLADAVAFLHAHRGFVSLITIDIGGNDVGLCVYLLDQTCLADALTKVTQNFPVILSELGQAAPGVPIVGMNYYDPLLVFWFTSPADAATANQMVVGQVNPTLEHVYADHSVPVADIETAFSTTDWTLVGGTPLNVLRICQWTWMCDPTFGGDVHANTTGYDEIAKAFDAVLPASLRNDPR
jgi:lysophospholipase L1-like esterase